jgi:protein involved in polysaccharide export with SLBB domain
LLDRGRPWLFITCLVLGACTDRATAPYPTSPPPPTSDAAVGPGDLFEVRVFGHVDLSTTYQVAQDGSINFPLIGTVAVEGMTAPAIEKELQTRLADGYLKNPSVSVRVTEYRSKKISVFGQVKSPGTFQFSDNMSVVEAISRAGGFTGMAKKNSVRVTRKEEGVNRRIEVAVEDIGQGRAPNFFLRPGDVVFVPERIF